MRLAFSTELIFSGISHVYGMCLVMHALLLETRTAFAFLLSMRAGDGNRGSGSRNDDGSSGSAVGGALC
jgi:hypothetical protein